MNRIKKINPNVEILRAVKEPEGHYFFGYYDLCPWNESERYILAHKSNFIDRMPKGNDEIEVGLVDLKGDNKFIPIGKTTAWNFQQGARLQWLPNEPNRVIYNIKEGNDVKSVIYDIKNKKKKFLSNSIYSISPKENVALTVNYARIKYYYAGLDDKFKESLAPESDGIFRVDLDSGKKTLILSTKKVAKFKNKEFNNIKSKHYLTMPTFNASGTKFCFLHRFDLKDGGTYTRLLVANPDGSGLSLVTEGTLSHFCWFDNSHILIWGRSKSYLTKVRKHKFFTLPIFKPILNFIRNQRGFLRHRVIGDQYMIFEESGKKIKSLGVGKLTEDGHPTRFNDSPWIITDTYPDKNHYRTLILYNIDKKERIELGKFYSIPEDKYLSSYNKENWDLSSMRSDLHPRWNKSGDKVCFDSVHEGRKNIYIIKLNKIIYK